MAQHGKTRDYVVEAELKMDASQTVDLTVDCWLFDNVDNITFTFFDRIAKHGNNCITDTFSVSNVWKMLSKISQVVFMESSNST